MVSGGMGFGMIPMSLKGLLAPSLLLASASHNNFSGGAMGMKTAPASSASAVSEPAVAPSSSGSYVPPAEPSRVTLRGSTSRNEGRVLIFVESFFGFGHFNIVDLLAKELIRQGIDVGVASSTFDLCGSSFDFGGAEKFYLPPLGVNAKGERCKPNQEPFRNNEDDYVDVIYTGTRQVLEAFEPELVVYELYPFMMQWRDGSARAVNDHFLDKGQPLPERISLCRDIIHASKPWTVLKRLDTYCSRLMIRGDSQFARLEESQKHWAKITQPIDYVGNFAAQEPPLRSAEFQDDIVIFGGGGYRAEKDARFLEAVAGVARFTEAYKDRSFKVILGEGTPEQVVDQMLEAGGTNTELMRPVSSIVFKQMLAGAAAVVTRAGYNTCFELVRMKKPFVVVPRELKEQRLRATMLERSGYGRVVREKDLSAEALARSLDTCITPINGSSMQFKFDGAERMAQSLAALLEKFRIARTRPA